jgi:peptidoglycan/LPS O-acetylase OafA/YrhL
VGFLDSLRFIAAFAVLLQHYLEREAYPWGLWFVNLGPGVFGVALFFIISGFVMPLSVQRGFAPADFAIKRLFRIYPLLLAIFLAVVVLSRLIPHPDFNVAREASLTQWLANLLLIQDFVGVPRIHGVTWTLILELIWYAIFAGAILAFRGRSISWLSILAPAGLIALTILSLIVHHRIPAGRIGMLYAAIFGMQAFRHFNGAIGNRRFWIDAAVFIGVMFAANAVAFGVFRHPTITLYQAVIPWLVGTALFLMVYAPSRVRHAAFLRSPVVVVLGEISYSIYLVHPLVIAVGQTYLHGLARMAFVIIGTVAVSLLTFRFIERPGMAVGRRVARLFPTKPLSTTAMFARP